MKKLELLIVLTLTLSFLSACATNKPVASSWSEKLREYQINPIFPPREDVYVGDIYFLNEDQTKQPHNGTPDETKFKKFGTLAHYLKLRSETEDHYLSRPSFPSTIYKDDGITVDVTKIKNSNGAYKSSNIQALKSVVFPNLLTASVSDRGLSGAIPGETLAATFGLKSKAVASASISIPQAESYGIPALKAFTRLKKDSCGKPDYKILTKNKKVFLVTEVFYTRSMNIIIDKSKTSGAKGEAIIAVDPKKIGKIVKEIKSILISTESEPPQIDSETQPRADSQVVSESVNSQNNSRQKQLSDIMKELDDTEKQLDSAVNNADVPGFGFWSIKSTAQNIHLNGTFHKPIAIGYRGIEVNSDCTGVTVSNLHETPFNTTVNTEPATDKPAK